MGRSGWPDDAMTRWARRVLRLVSLLVPGARRARWRREWEAELFELRRRKAAHLDTLAFVVGSIPHGVWERKEEWSMDSLRQDLGFSLRTLRGSPGFTLAALLMLGLGIGAATALFSVLEIAILRPPPYPEPDRLVVVDISRKATGEAPEAFPWSYPKFEVAKANLDKLEILSGYDPWRVTLTGAGDATIVGAEVIEAPYLDIVGVRPILGRPFLEGDDAPDGSALVTLLSYGLWKGRFGGNPGIVGRTVTLNGNQVEVVGVLPDGFSGITGTARLWLPFRSLPVLQHPRRLEMVWAHFFHAVGRLAPDATLESARAQAVVAGQAMYERYPDPRDRATEWGVMLTPFSDARVNPVTRTSLLALGGAVVLLLLIACANVAGLLLARGAGRRREAAVRSALGASRTRLVRQLLTESVLIAVAGGALGLGVAWLGVDFLAVALSDAIGTTASRWLEYVDPDALSLDGGVLGFSVLLSVTTGLLFGWWPAVWGSRPELVEALKEGSGGLEGSRGRGTPVGRGLLVVGQMGLALVLLMGAGVMVRSLQRLQAVPLGMDPEHVLTASYSLAPGDPAAEDATAFHEEVMSRIRALPGVEGVTVGCPPLSGGCDVTAVIGIEGHPPRPTGEYGFIGVQYVGDQHFQVLRADLVSGREFTSADRAQAPLAIVLNETAARDFFPGGDPVGRRMKIGVGPFHDNFAEIVGVVADVLFRTPEEGPMAQAFVPFRQMQPTWTTLIIRTDGEPAAIVPQLRRVVGEINPNLPFSEVLTMEERMGGVTARTRVLSLLLAVFAAAALTLAAAGVYGVIAFSVAQRTRELGLRVALGAGRPEVLRLVLSQALKLVGAGLLLGAGGAFLVTRALESLLFGVTAVEVGVWVGVSLILVLVSGIAGYVPARRATGVDPMVALRAD